MRVTLLIAITAMVLGCGTTGGPGWTPQDCAGDVRLLEMIGERINRLVRDSGHDAVPQADWDRYASLKELLIAVGCPRVPESWERPE